MASCPFCEIVDGRRTGHVLYEDDRTVAFLDGNPAVPGHALVAPRDHREYLFTEDELLSAGVFRTVRTVVRAMNRALEPDGVSVFYTSAGLVGSVTHAHVHLVPRSVDDDIHIALAREPLDDADAERLAGLIRENVQSTHR